MCGCVGVLCVYVGVSVRMDKCGVRATRVRERYWVETYNTRYHETRKRFAHAQHFDQGREKAPRAQSCLLYTSDAADD